ncbi:WD-40 repeat protein [Chloroherpeton thalassium ATCC 35110]|uniref:WD-40 repeat protein n=1 Tax=Chloroherpeton thalassium (strain ATCC 35110 / GB-78) TaxID=517418 RepID=B3QW13_CHLT3|nr:TIR domain-containing protein [Chloroherpeton thalassium]ACF14667.1 WD-40 repeat protein [Chloroherpeton thalassium ATCC 35110]
MNLTVSAHDTVHDKKPKQSFASRVFGYDIFLSFALGPPPRGTQSYTANLAHRLQERNFSVFFSEKEAPPGEHLDSTLQKALLRSKTLVVIANRGTLEAPRWVRKEVEEFRKNHPKRPIIIINIGNALQQLSDIAAPWLQYKDKIWLDETEQAAIEGIASDEVVERLATAPTRVKSNVRWRWLMGGIIAILVALGISLGLSAINSHNNYEQRLQEEKKVTALRLTDKARNMISGNQNTNEELVLFQLLAAHSIYPSVATEAGLVSGLLQLQDWQKILMAGSEVYSVTYSPDGNQIFSGSCDGLLPISLHIWDAKTGQSMEQFPLDNKNGYSDKALSSPYTGHAAGLEKIALMVDELVKQLKIAFEVADAVTSGRQDILGRLDSMGVSSKEQIAKAVKALQIMKAQGLIDEELQKSLDIKAIEGGMNEYIKSLKYGISSLVFSPDGSKIVSGSRNGVLRLWNSKTGEGIGDPLKTRQGEIHYVAFSPDGDCIVSGHSDGTLRLWNITTGESIAEPLKGHKFGVTCAAFSPDGDRVVSGSFDWTLRLWNAKTGEAINDFSKDIKHSVGSVVFSPDGSMIATGGLDSTLRLCNAETGKSIGLPMYGHKEGINCLAFSPDGSRLVSGGQDSTLRLWDVKTGQGIGPPLSGHHAGVKCVAFSPDGNWVASGSSDGTIRLWPAASKVLYDELAKKLSRNMSHREWNEWISSEIPYMKLIPDLSVPPDEP